MRRTTNGAAVERPLNCSLLKFTVGSWEIYSMKNMIGLTGTLAMLFAVQVHSDEMTKCISPQGQVTYVQHQCPHGAYPNEWIDVNNLPPSGAGMPTQMADPAILENRSTMQVNVIDSGPKPRDMSAQSPIQKEMEAARKARAERMKNEATRTTN